MLNTVFLGIFPVWIGIFWNLCGKPAPQEPAYALPPTEGGGQGLQGGSVLETVTVTAAVLLAIAALCIWWTRRDAARIRWLLGLQTACLTALIVLIYNSVRDPGFGFGAQIPMWLGNLTAQAGLATLVTMVSWFVATRTSGAALPKIMLSVNLFATALVCAGWMALIYAMNYCM